MTTPGRTRHFLLGACTRHSHVGLGIAEECCMCRKTHVSFDKINHPEICRQFDAITDGGEFILMRQGVRHDNRLCNSLHWNFAKRTYKQRRTQANTEEPSNNQSKQPSNRTTIRPNLQTPQRTTSEQASIPPQPEPTEIMPHTSKFR